MGDEEPTGFAGLTPMQEDAAVADEVGFAAGRVRLVDLVGVVPGSRVDVDCAGRAFSGRVIDAGVDWFAIAEPALVFNALAVERIGLPGGRHPLRAADLGPVTFRQMLRRQSGPAVTRLLDLRGRWWKGSVAAVGVDFVMVSGPGRRDVIPLGRVAAFVPLGGL